DGRYRAPGDASAIRSGPRPSLCGRRATIRHVFVTGKQIVRDGKVLAFDYRDPQCSVANGQRRAIQKVPRLDWTGRDAVEIKSPTFPSRWVPPELRLSLRTQASAMIEIGVARNDSSRATT